MNKKYIENYGFLGIGQCGSNLTRKFEEKGYPCIIANSSIEDLSTIKNAKNKLHFVGGEGCHKDRKKSRELLRNNIEYLLDEVKAKMPNITTLFVCASSAGGTGSGALAICAKVLASKLDINICVVTVLPSKEEHYQSQANVVELFRELETLDDIGATFILDNSKSESIKTINDIFFTHLDALLSNENGSEFGCMDRGEINKLLSTSGMAIISKIGRDKADKLVESLTNNNIYAPIENNKVVKYIGAMCCDAKPELNEIYSRVGNPIDVYIGTDSPSYVYVLTGLSFPKTRLNEIKKIAKTNAEIIQKNIRESETSIFDDDISFLNIFNSKSKKEDKKIQEDSCLDILNSFINE